MKLVHRLARRFDPDQGRCFATFAVPTIVGERKRHFHDHRWNVRVPRSTQDNYIRVRETVETLLQDLSQRIAEQIGVSQMHVCRLLNRSLDTLRTLAR